MQDIFKKHHKKFFLVLTLAVIFLGVFFRVWKFDSWVHVKADQVRDAKLVSHSLEEGPGSLPLLGPKAGGTKLRLGPIFYYFQYASATVFSSAAPPVLAYPNLLFSLLSIPLFYFFSSLFFSRFVSASLTAIFSLSFLAVEYSRFAWNPNSTVFFSLLFFYALARIFSDGEKKRNWWMAVLALAFSVDSQLHFVSLLGLLVSVFFFLLFQGKSVRKYLFWRDALIFFPIVLFFYIPVIISDILTRGSNAQEFIEAISGKSSEKSILKNLWKDTYYFGQYFFRILSGYLGSGKIYHYLGVGVVFSGVVFSSLALFFKKGKEKTKAAARLALAAFLGFFVLFIPLATSIDKPRFYLSIFWLPFIFLGIIYEYFSFFKKNLGKTFFLLVVAAFSFSNFFFDYIWFSELSQSEKGQLDSKKTMVLFDKKDPLWLPWGRQAKIAQVFLKNCSEKKIYFSSSKQVRDFWKSIELAFELDPKSTDRSIFDFKKIPPKENGACYFYLAINGDKLAPDLEMIASKPINVGSVLVYWLDVASGESDLQKKAEADKDFNETGTNLSEENVDESSDADFGDDVADTSGNKRRMYWRDVFRGAK